MTFEDNRVKVSSVLIFLVVSVLRFRKCMWIYSS